LGDECVG